MKHVMFCEPLKRRVEKGETTSCTECKRQLYQFLNRTDQLKIEKGKSNASSENQMRLQR
jgi:hypothetical protein